MTTVEIVLFIGVGGKSKSCWGWDAESKEEILLLSKKEVGGRGRKRKS